MSPEKPNEREAELYELKMPGEFIGKEVINSEARKIGIVRSVRLKLVPLEVSLIVKGIEIEFPVNAKDVEVVGSLIKLKIPAKYSEEIEIQDVINLREELFTEMKALLHSNEGFPFPRNHREIARNRGIGPWGRTLLEFAPLGTH